MRDCIVVFDTNSYRYLAREIPDKQILDLNKIEKKNSITSLGSHYVAFELISHLSDKTDPHFENCYQALNLLYKHIKYDKNLHFIANAEAILCKLLYKELPPYTDEVNHRLVNLIYKIISDKNNLQDKIIHKEVSRIEQELNEIEERFLDELRRSIIKRIKPNSEKWNSIKEDSDLRKRALTFLNSKNQDYYTAYSNVIKAANALEIRESYLETHKKVLWVKSIFKVQLEFYRLILKKIWIDGANADKGSRRNWIWDLHIILCLGNNLLFNEKEVYLITSDGEILEAASNAGADKYVLKLEEYLTACGFYT